MACFDTAVDTRHVTLTDIALEDWAGIGLRIPKDVHIAEADLDMVIGVVGVVPIRVQPRQ